MVHDFKLWPELTNSQMQFYYFDSPHKQMVEDFTAKVVKVTDGDTIRVVIAERNFSFPIRFAKIAAPELDEDGGNRSQSWLESQILGEEVDVKLSKSRVEKWGRLLAEVFFLGINMGQMSIDNGLSIPWESRGGSEWR